MTTARPDHLHIPGTFNYRDVGGLRTASGTKIRSGVLLRSAQLCRLDERGHDILRRLGVATVHDLRGPGEADRMGVDVLPEGVRLEVTPFDSAVGSRPPHEAPALPPHEAPAHRHLDLLQVYSQFPSLPEAGAAITAMARSLARGDGAVLVHCAAGKDRTGWAVATLLRAVGVVEDDVLADYLLSNEAVEALAADVARNSGAPLPPALLGVSVEYLAAGTEAMHRRYGNLDGYLEAIGFTPQLRAALHTRLLE
ncbi:tyrosine-protein phosphatase [Nocardia veterana]|uniref:Tyrosine-protein phosphatase n=1 Tax=Nocardia veterana TaxID=132249 RepID=A0A7X6LWV8_9NOCA|nr:tyrosine-protein phosphatase [Nocardia veterana]NKY85967.1 tyrosine-protein phosphatase [Nocardia veterana]